MGGEKYNLKVSKRKITGRAVKTLRREGIVPGNLFGKKTKSLAIQLPAENFAKIFEDAGETSIINIEVEGEKETRPVLISAVQNHPVTGVPLHVDFHEVDLTQKVTATIPVELVGVAPAVEDLGAVVVQQISELDVEALPADLPEKLEVDISGLKQFDDTVTVADIKLDKSKVEIVDTAPETIVVQATEPQKEEEPAPVEAEAAEGEAAPAEGEAPAEGQPKEEKKEEAQ